MTQGPTNPIEQTIRTELGVPPDAGRVMIFAQSAHMDWDWLNAFTYNATESGPQCTNPDDPSFSNYFRGSTQPADTILAQATLLLTQFPEYWWSICEIGFLRQFAADNPTQFKAMVGTGRLSVVGGGITSPDNLLSAGETFLRVMLVGVQWATGKGLTWSGQVWMPDDFGHDSQLPVILVALGALGVGFARIPGACDQSPPTPTVGDAAKTLLGQQAPSDPGGIDFWWRAADGSQVLAHWLPNHYAQGDGIATGDYEFTAPAALSVCGTKSSLSGPMDHINSYLNLNGPVSPTPYVLVDFGSDFKIPIGSPFPDSTPDATVQLGYYASQWNQGTGAQSYAGTGAWVVVATFDHYVRLVRAHAADSPSLLQTRMYHGNAGSELRFRSHPYWMGFYASRPELKILHDRGTRALLGAEVYALLSGQPEPAAIAAGWNDLTPSTHHDYITGTATVCVYTSEQLPLLQQAVSEGESARDSLLRGVAQGVSGGEPVLTTFNQLGFEHAGLAELPAANELSPIPPDAAALQVSSDGGWLGLLDAPALGYRSSPFSVPPATIVEAPSITSDGDIVLRNTRVAITVSGKDLTLTSVTDLSTGEVQFAGPANVLSFFSDVGGSRGVYQFSYEQTESGALEAIPVTVEVKTGTVQILESGPIRARVRGTVGVKGQNPCIDESYVITYDLVAGEPMIRVSVSGKAPDNTTVMAAFPFADDITTLVHGTPYHWDQKSVVPFRPGTTGWQPTFEPVHDFVVAQSGDGTRRGAVYTGSMRAWTAKDKNLYGSLLRNSGGVGTWDPANDPGPSDPDAHTIEYALRVVGDLPAPDSGGLLREARRFRTPLVAASVAGTGSGTISAGLASITAPAAAILTAAKQSAYDPATVILRLYQPTNSCQSVTLDVTGLTAARPGRWTATPVTALELPIAGAEAQDVVNGQVTVKMEYALLTLALSQTN